MDTYSKDDFEKDKDGDFGELARAEGHAGPVGALSLLLGSLAMLLALRSCVLV
jgi:hypothetical protein